MQKYEEEQRDFGVEIYSECSSSQTNDRKERSGDFKTDGDPRREIRKTNCEKMDDIIEKILKFECKVGEKPETAWDRFAELRFRMEKENVKDNFDNFLLTLFLKKCQQANMVGKNETSKYREILENRVEENAFENFKSKFRKEKIIGDRVALKITEENEKAIKE